MRERERERERIYEKWTNLMLNISDIYLVAVL